jgi:hypothetical protein
MGVRRLCALFLGFTCASCGLRKPPEKIDQDARHLMNYLRTDRLESARAMLGEINIPFDSLMKVLAAGRYFIRAFPADSFTVVGWNVLYMGNDTTGDLTYEARGGGRTALFRVVVLRRGGPPTITTLRWQETAKPLAVANAFTLAGKSPTHYLFLALVALVPLICIAAAVFAGMQRLGPIWIVISLIGVCSFSIDWTNGGIAINPLSFHLLGAGFVRAGTVAPWILTWSVPVGAIAMLITWQRRRRSQSATVGVASPTVLD